MTPSEYIKINNQRWSKINAPYNPISGEGSDCCERVEIRINDADYKVMYLPYKMMEEPLIILLNKVNSFKKAADLLSKNGAEITAKEVAFTFIQIRIRYDFEFWAYSFVKIKEKLSDEAVKSGKLGKMIQFKLNRGQRKLLRRLYKSMLNGEPIRVILLKARQWGGSTLVQIFMMWMQLVIHKQWNSVICAHVENTARIVRGMYTKALKLYPFILVEGSTKRLELIPYEGSQKTRQVIERDCTMSIGSAEKPEGMRGEDVNMAHFSEVAMFTTTSNKKPEDLIQSIVSGIPLVKDTMIVYESTAKGVGNFFHREWIRAKKGESGFDPVFVAWFEIESYSKEVKDIEEFIKSLTEEEKAMFRDGATLEHIAWYRDKKKAYSDIWRFVSEFPSNDIEAFQSTGHRFYNIGDVEKLRKYCSEPLLVGDVMADAVHGSKALENIKFQKDNQGHLKVWSLPDDVKMGNNRFVVVVDVNRGTSKNADNGIIAVFDRYWMKEGGVPEIVAEWSGHIMMRFFIWKAVQIAKLYQNALLVIESNTPDSAGQSGFEMESVFDEISAYYDNLYSRTPADQIKEGVPLKYGFHTNKSSKMMVCTHQQLVLAEDLYIERCLDAANEHDTFEVKDDGSLGAVDGARDDRHITRAIGNWICYSIDRPYLLDDRKFETYKKTIINEASL